MKQYLRSYASRTFGMAAAILLTTCGVLFASTQPGSWREIDTGLPGAGVGVGSVTIDPSDTATVYARTYRGNIFKTTDGGASWTAISTVVGVGSLVIDPKNSSTLYVSTDHGVFKSTNGGRSWIGANTGLTNSYLSKLTIDPTTPSTLYAVGYDGMSKSTNAADSWVTFDTGLSSDTYIQALALDPTVPSTIYVSYSRNVGAGGLINSTNGGESWNVLPNTGGIDVNRMAFDPTTSSTIYVPARGGVFKSIDGGLSWTLLNAGLPEGAYGSSVAIDPTTPSTIYVSYVFNFGIGGGIAKSMDGGTSGNRINNGLPPDISVGSLAVDPTAPNIIYAGTLTNGGQLGNGVFKSTDGGSSWDAANTGLTTIDIRALAIDPISATTVYAGGIGGLFKTVNNGENWTNLIAFQIPTPFFPPGISSPPFGAGPGAVNSVAIDFLNPNNLYAVTQRIGGCASPDKVLFKSTNGGANWDNNVSPWASGCVLSLLAIDTTDPNTLYVGKNDPIDAGYWLLKSTDGGSTWNNIWDWTKGLESGLNALVIDPSNPVVLYAGRDDDYFISPEAGGLFKSVDGGASWSKTNLGATAVSVLAIDPTNSNTLYAATESFYNKPKGFRGLFKSSDGGSSWVSISRGLEEAIASRFRMTILAVDPNSPNMVYAGTSGGGVFRSTDGGSTWAPFNDGLGNFDVRVFAFGKGDSRILYAGTAGGVFAMTLVP